MSKPINREKAESLIDEYRNLRDKVKREAIDKNDPEKDKIDVFIQRDKNAFVFKKNDIVRFFEAGATHLLVFHGAHPEREDGFEKGSYTVVTVGCRLENNVYKAVIEDDPATQYPEREALDDIPDNFVEDSGKDKIYFSF